jgi:hypothetical protein
LADFFRATCRFFRVIPEVKIVESNAELHLKQNSECRTHTTIRWKFKSPPNCSINISKIKVKVGGSGSTPYPAGTTSSNDSAQGKPLTNQEDSRRLKHYFY